ncbi:hypothetical protein SFC79_12610 [Nocardioides sp. S-58]|uniref:Uncharacterized protein n=1 Tax=Nocardioides renjunii TaxID=3095075 RepID=A0ABU5KCA9_9ACTN|nr:hypothetical protein [Nocardioides sp. S-58]MDZ5662608.1 hypothetical protein [Nocardioides sp. S-58]
MKATNRVEGRCDAGRLGGERDVRHPVGLGGADQVLDQRAHGPRGRPFAGTSHHHAVALARGWTPATYADRLADLWTRLLPADPLGRG